MKILNILASLILLVLMSSCHFSENIYFKEDGSGRVEFKLDASQFLKMTGKAVDSTEERVDSLLVFKTLFDEKRDSISKLPKEEQEKLKRLEGFSLRTLVDPTTKEMSFNLMTDFKSVNELSDMFGALNSASTLKGKANQGVDKTNPLSAFGENGTSKVEYTFKKNRFKRIGKIINEKAHKQMVDSLGEAAMMFSSSKYKINYHFPKKIKSVSLKNAMFSEDKKTVTVEYDLMSYIKNPELLNLEVVLEK